MPPTEEVRPHVVTPELAERGNALLREAARSLSRARALARAIEGLETLREEAYAAHRRAQREAALVLTGVGC